MSNPRKALGSALETRVVARAQQRGLKAHRQPLSGQLREYPNDVVVEDVLVECKVRSRHPNFSEMQEWLEGCQENAKRKKMRAGILVYNAKGSRTPRVTCDLEHYLDLLELALLDSNKREVV